MTGIAYPDALQGLLLKITQTYRNVLITTKIATKGKIFEENGNKKPRRCEVFQFITEGQPRQSVPRKGWKQKKRLTMTNISFRNHYS